VIRANAPGHEIEAPMAAVILGGLVTSTVLNLFLMPTIYAAFAKGRGEVGGREFALTPAE
jgi:Cu/Ag efflux pump CusA